MLDIINRLTQGYSQDLCELILKSFDSEPFEHQPVYLMQTGCGDGALLRMVYEAIETGSPRGRVLQQYPLICIGVERDEGALEAAADWQRLYGERIRHRISLPSYLFAKERYWVTQGADRAVSATRLDRLPAGAAQLHPLLHCNTSNLWGQRFSSTFTIEQYENLLEKSRELKFGTRNMESDWDFIPQAMESLSGPTLFLKRIKEFHREYEWVS